MKQQFFMDAAKTFDMKKPQEQKKEKGMEVSHYCLSERKKQFQKGDYFTITFSKECLYDGSKNLEKSFQKILTSFLHKYHKKNSILFLGLGNSSILGDSFGPRVVEKLIATNQYNDFLTIPKMALFCPETTAKTGISSFRLISMVVSYLKPDLIVLLDSFVTNQKKYLNQSIEINDCGIVFQDQLRDNKKIDYQTFHIPVLSIGYPCLFKDQGEYYEKSTLCEDIELMSDFVARGIRNLVL